MSSNAAEIEIVGIGDDGLEGLTAAARSRIEAAEVLLGTPRHLEQLGHARARLLPLSADLDELVALVRQHEGQRVVVLASGDPLFYGVARYLCDRLGKERFHVTPHVSSMQLAFARVKENWDEAYLANLAAVDLARVVGKTRSAEKVGLFTTDRVSPSVVAQALLDEGIDYFVAYVCENLGSPDERVTQAELSEVAELSFAPLNVMILIRKPNVPDRPQSMAGQRLFGNPDETFAQSQPKRGLLTPLEIRAVALALLDLGPRSIVWDVGAGSGSVSIEAARLAVDGTIYAIEMDPEDHALVKENARRFGTSNVQAILGQAPEAWEQLPDPDAIFVGGSGRSVPKIAELACQRLRPAGRIVVHVQSIDNLAAVSRCLQQAAADTTVRMMQIAESTQQLDSLRLESRNPTFLIHSVK